MMCPTVSFIAKLVFFFITIPDARHSYAGCQGQSDNVFYENAWIWRKSSSTYRLFFYPCKRRASDRQRDNKSHIYWPRKGRQEGPR